MSVLHRIRLFTRHFGVDVSRYPGFDPVALLVRLLGAHRVEVVLDVGANAGRYGFELRQAGYRGRIVSFEPLREPFELLHRRVASDPLWDALPYALGDHEGVATLNVAANAGESSSILPMLDTHVDAYPSAGYVGTEDVEMRTVDSIAAQLLSRGQNVFLKADVQGYEKPVLAGARETLAQSCVGIQLELSMVPLYDGGMLYREALDFAEQHGFALMGIIPGFTDVRNGRMLQADGVFFRES
ncbi:FkbM family methyltransferase [Mycolicibacterium novocastrense]|nr:FkbM family methyltransferase [Mycolicibacterium novocastrense]